LRNPLGVPQQTKQAYSESGRVCANSSHPNLILQ
jgi:hypothetical protein